MIGYTPTPDYYNDYICHYGVKGMKWRHRKSRGGGHGFDTNSIEKRIRTTKQHRKMMEQNSSRLHDRKAEKQIANARHAGEAELIRNMQYGVASQQKKKNIMVDYNPMTAVTAHNDSKTKGHSFKKKKKRF